MKLTPNQINAVACAIAVMEGTAGGYAPHEKAKHKQTLIELLKQNLPS